MLGFGIPSMLVYTDPPSCRSSLASLDLSFGVYGLGFLYLVAEFISPPKVYTLRFIVGHIYIVSTLLEEQTSGLDPGSEKEDKLAVESTMRLSRRPDTHNSGLS